MRDRACFRAPCASVLVLAALAGSAHAQTGANIVRGIRPLVHITPSGTNVTGTPRLAMGIFDTGNFSLFVPPETNAHWGITPTAATAAGNVNTNFGVVSRAADFRVGGYLGGTFNGPEVVNGPPLLAVGPAHIFQNGGATNETQPFSRTGIQGSLTYFNTGGGSRFSEPNIGAAFYNGTGTEDPLVSFVDPSNGSWLSFDSGDSTGAGGLQRSSVPLDQTTSSVSFLAPRLTVSGNTFANPNVPTATRNLNPNFMFVIPLTGVSGDGEVPVNAADPFRRYTTTVPAGNGATLGFMPQATINGTLAAQLGPAQGGANNGNLITGSPTLKVDTGAPGTSATLLGTDYLNGFGQYWDFSRAQLLMFAPRLMGDRDLVGNGMLMTVDRSTVGLTRTAVNRYNLDGMPGTHVPTGGPGLNPGDPANANGDTRYGRGAAGVGPGEQATVIYRTHMTHSNAGYIDGISALGLKGQAQGGASNDQIDGMSVGADTIARDSGLYFSVDRQSEGLSGTGQGFGGGVVSQSVRRQQAGDVFQSFTGSQNTNPGRNALRFNQDLMGISANMGPLEINDAGQDNLMDFDLRATDGFNGASAARAMRNTDPVIRRPETAANTFNPGKNVLSQPGGAANPLGDRSDLYGTNFMSYFSLDANSPSLTPNAVSPADVLVNRTDGTGWRVFATAARAGLAQGDDIDAIAMSRVLPGLIGNLIAGTMRGADWGPGYVELSQGGVGFAAIDIFDGFNADTMLFSLARGSASLGEFDEALGRNLSAADVFITDFDGRFTLFASAESLGLNASTDNIDGLDSVAVPAPAVGVLGALVGITGLRRRRTA